EVSVNMESVPDGIQVEPSSSGMTASRRDGACSFLSDILFGENRVCFRRDGGLFDADTVGVGAGAGLAGESEVGFCSDDVLLDTGMVGVGAGDGLVGACTVGFG